MSVDYKSTLQLPETAFPMRAGLAKREPETIKFWEENRIYEKMLESAKDHHSFIFHDGPPYANGAIHIGHALNKSLKDFVVKYKSMRGYYVPYVPGWDTHGLPIELKVLKDQHLNKDAVPALELRSRCHDYALKYVDLQREGMKRLGCFSLWSEPYLTLDPVFEARELETLAAIVEKGLVYRGTKPVYWCLDCQTAEAAAEIEYQDVTSPSVYVAYQMGDDVVERFPQLKGRDVNVVVWTTTPWTLPASRAVALNAGMDYSFFEVGDKVYLIADGMAEAVSRDTSLDFAKRLLTVKGKELELLSAEHPLYPCKTPLVLAAYVTLDAGTGCVHTAPAYGVDDFETGQRYHIEAYNPVDATGHYKPDTPVVAGLSLDEGGKKTLEILNESGRLLAVKKITHSYPHCWRCHKPVIFRSTPQWFIDVSAFKKRALEVIDNEVKWIPSWGHDRIYNMVSERSDWCISRQRVWGVPIPAFECEDCGETVLDAGRIRRVARKVAEEGSDAWWAHSAEELLGDLNVCPHCGGHRLKKGDDILDVWFDSGASHFSVLDVPTRPYLSWPSDLYLEGADQHRGWFQTSLLTAVAVKGQAPYRAVLTHGFIVDEQGRKMSKSLKNGVAPEKVTNRDGADILRLWVASADYRSDVHISDGIIRSLSEQYRRIRNTARFILGNLKGFDPAKHQVPREKMGEFDCWALASLNRVIDRVTEGFETYDFHMPVTAVYQFCTNDLSSFYLDAAKDRLYADGENSLNRRACQTVMWKIITAMTRLLAPVLSFTAEEIWQQLRGIDPSFSESVFLAGWPQSDPVEKDEQLLEKWEKLKPLRAQVSKALENERAAGKIGQSLEARVVVAAPEFYRTALPEELWNVLCITSGFEFTDEVVTDDAGIKVDVFPARGTKCPRCWKYEETTRPDGLCKRCGAVIDGK